MSGELGLPSCIAVRSKSTGKYLRYVHEEDGETYKRLQLDGEDALGPFARFDVEPSLRHEGLVHIRCRYNRKYWVARQHGAGDPWVLAGADEPEEDLAKPSCTLLEAVPVATADGTEDEPVMYFRFAPAAGGNTGTKNDDEARTVVSDGSTACLRIGGGSHPREPQEGGGDGLVVLNLANSSKRLPRLVVFKGPNGRYLSARTLLNRNHLTFASQDIGDPTVVHEIEYHSNGRDFNVRSRAFNRLWRRGPNVFWILADTTAGTAREAIFNAIQVNDFFALRNMVTNSLRFCINQTAERQLPDCLDAVATTITREARIVVEEAVLSREIRNIDYRLGEVRVYDTEELTLVTTSAVNDTSTDNTKRLRLFCEETETTTWDATVELKLSYEATLRVGFPKLGLGATATISAEFFGAYNWGQTLEKTVKHEVEYEVTVPARTRVAVQLIATKSSYDVPFNYTQRDILVDGTIRDTSHRDGLFTGRNSYNFKFQTTEEKIPERKRLAS